MSDEFQKFESLIELAAKSNPGFIGKENWVSLDGKRRNVTYFWRDQNALLEFSRHPKHLQATERYNQLENGFRLIISEVINS